MSPRFKVIVLSVLLLGLVLPGQLRADAPKTACYSLENFRSEQFLRFKEQLMMTTMLCPKFSRSDLNVQMQTFIDRNADFIRAQEARLRNHFRSEGANDPSKVLLQVKTQIANELSERLTQYAPQEFCGVMIPHVEEARLTTPRELKQRLALIKNGERLSTRPLCEQYSSVESNKSAHTTRSRRISR